LKKGNTCFNDRGDSLEGGRPMRNHLRLPFLRPDGRFLSNLGADFMVFTGCGVLAVLFTLLVGSPTLFCFVRAFQKYRCNGESACLFLHIVKIACTSSIPLFLKLFPL